MSQLLCKKTPSVLFIQFLIGQEFFHQSRFYLSNVLFIYKVSTYMQVRSLSSIQLEHSFHLRSLYLHVSKNSFINPAPI